MLVLSSTRKMLLFFVGLMFAVIRFYLCTLVSCCFVCYTATRWLVVTRKRENNQTRVSHTLADVLSVWPKTSFTETHQFNLREVYDVKICFLIFFPMETSNCSYLVRLVRLLIFSWFAAVYWGIIRSVLSKNRKKKTGTGSEFHEKWNDKRELTLTKTNDTEPNERKKNRFIYIINKPRLYGLVIKVQQIYDRQLFYRRLNSWYVIYRRNRI